VRLFADRATNKHPGFELTPENAQAVAQVCARLEGIPLAVELAAARIGMLSAGQISERLGHSLKLLTGEDRTADHRHQTLRVALEWSFDLLGEPEQMLFRRLSAFAGGFTLDAAENVGGRVGIDEEDILGLLSHLVDKSLVVAKENWETGARYRLLEPIRQYAREKLEVSGEAEAVGRRHTEISNGKIAFIRHSDIFVMNSDGTGQTNLTRTKAGVGGGVWSPNGKMSWTGRKFPSSIEALLRRALKGGEPPRINPLVDFYNAVSLRHVVPAGGFDLEEIDGTLEFSLTRQEDTFQPLDDSSEVSVEPGEVAYASGNEILTRYFVWKQSRKGLLDESTRSLFLVSEVLGEVESDSGVEDAVLKDFADGLRRYFNSEPAVFLIGEEDPEVTL